MRSLRLRLLLSFGLVIALCLIAAGFGSVWLLRDEQAAAAEVRIGRLVEPISQRLRRMQATGAPTARVAEELVAYARFFQVRILLVDGDNRVLMDTDTQNPLVGEVVEQPDRHEVEGPSESYRSAPRRIRGEDLFLFGSSIRDPGGFGGPTLGVPPLAVPSDIRTASILVAVPAGDVTAAWEKLLPRFLLAGGISALASVVVAGVIARRITRPLVQMTGASRAIAQGDFSQRIDVHGDDEVAVLGAAFNEMAQQVDRSQRTMRQLLADVSHDLKTPLTSIQGYSQAMLDGVLEDEAERAHAAEIVHQEAERMRALVEDLLYLSQIEAGQLPLTLEPVVLDDVVAAAAQRFRYQAETAGVTVRQELAGAPVLADERRLEQVLANLLDNAIRHAPQGSEVLLCTARSPGGVLFEVHNGGTPIPAEDLSHVFDRFYQVDRARTRAGHSGLGLAIVRQLVQAHGGEITVQSTSEGGTVFSVKLPLASAAPPAARPAPSHDEPERGPASASAST